MKGNYNERIYESALTERICTFQEVIHSTGYLYTKFKAKFKTL